MGTNTDVDARLRAGDHAVVFFHSDDELAEHVAHSAGAALAGGASAVIIAAANHRELFRAALSREDDVDALVGAGRLLLLDARTCLARFMVDGRPDRSRFRESLGSAVSAAASRGSSVWAYGEMVAVLWEDGNIAAAMELERLWGELVDTMPLALLCAYPAWLVAAGTADQHAEVCGLHSSVFGNPSVEGRAHVERRFSAGADAPRAARAFAALVLADWGCRSLGDGLALVVTELATNAVRHARSAFRVALSRDGDTVTVRVADASPDPPTLRAVDPTVPYGRGLQLVNAIARRWGHEDTGDGKVVWAELALRRERNER